MKITGANYIGFSTGTKGKDRFQAFSPAANSYLEEHFTLATTEELESALALSEKAFIPYSELPFIQRAGFLDAIGEEIVALGDALINRCVAESGLPAGRIIGERDRTCAQLKTFAQLLRDGWWVDARIDRAQPQRMSVPKPDIRRMFIPIGPIAVFGASNFPLAFSTAGGDTAAALAAGCPVIVKSHSSHAGTNELVAAAIVKAAQRTGMPEGVFSSVYLSHAAVTTLVQHPVIKAVGFTGSRQVGMALFNAAAARPDPIPVFAEMSALNPVILLENALNARREQIAKGLAGSLTMGAGQFCTNPGLILAIDNTATRSFLEVFAVQLSTTLPATMLNRNIHTAYNKSITALENTSVLKLLSKASQEANALQHEARPVAFTVQADDFLSNPVLSDEVFGPATIIVLCRDQQQLQYVLQSLEGQLTVTVHAAEDDAQTVQPLVSIMSRKAGRIIYGGFPTGVEVCHAMQHGGPFPSTTDSRFTSVGSAAIYRFLRPVAYQDFPDELLPAALKKDNPLKILRLVDGDWTKE